MTDLEKINRYISKVREVRLHLRNELSTADGLVLDKEQTEELLTALMTLCEFLEDLMDQARASLFEGLEK